jgi:hypothetical protein
LAGKVDHGAHFLAAEKIVALSPAEKETVRGHVEAIIQDRELRGSRRCQHLLTFIVAESLSGNFQNLRERVIGEKVFGRSSSYDTGADAVVRVSANELRKRLAQCYLKSGNVLKVQISIPSGSYIPEFRFKEDAEISPAAAEIPVPVIEVSPRKMSWQSAAIAGLSIALLLTLTLAAGMWRKLHQAIPESPPAKFLPWTAVLDGTSPAFIVLGDTGAAASQDLLHSGLSLDDYIRHNYIPAGVHADARTSDLSHYLTAKRFTSVADAEIAVRVNQINPFPRHRPILRFAREMQVDDFKNSNAILIDSKRTNPWVELFQNRLNFHVVFDESLRRHVVQNQSPKNGEKSLYVPAGTTGTAGEAYAVLALLPNLSSSGYVLIIEGTNMEGTEAAGEFAADSARISKALEGIGLASESQPRAFELFLRVDATGGTSSHAEVIAFRLDRSKPINL